MRARRAVMAAGALGGVLIFGIGAVPASAVPPERDPERYSTAAAGWGYLATDKVTIDGWLNQYSGRAIDVETTATGWSVVSVDNTVPGFTRTPGGSFSWTVGETAASLTSKINLAPRKRLIDLERYTVGGTTRFAAAWVDNTGAAAKGWWWWLNQSPAQIVSKLNDCQCRLIDIDPLGDGRYDVIMIPNTGVDALAWWWFVGATPTQISNAMADNGARPVDLEPDGTDRFAALMVADGITGGYAINQSWAQLTSGPPPGMRYVHVKNYRNAAGTSVWLSVRMRNG